MNMSLVMVTQDGKVKEFPVKSLPVTIGRAEDCRMRVPLDSVSRHHCELLENDDEELVVRDLKSSNGTYVNRERIKTRELVPGDLLSVGPIVFVVRLGEHPKDIDAKTAYEAGAVAVPGGGPSGVAAAAAVSAASPGGPKTAASSAPTRIAPSPTAKPAPKPAPKADDDDFESILKDLSESDFDIDFGEDEDEPKKKA